MSDLVTTLDVELAPDAMRTVVRPFSPGDPAGYTDPKNPRSLRIVERVMSLDETELERELKQVEASLDARHRDVKARLLARFDELDEMVRDRGDLSEPRRLLIGAYFSEEFSFESAALFNPSVVALPDQSDAPAGGTRFVMSLRGIGEGHVSSLAFRTGVWRADGGVELDEASAFAVGPTVERREGDKGQVIVDAHCGGALSISETVVFPFMPSQGRGIEDVRLTPFTEEDGSTDVRGTFTAFNGSDVRQAMLRTSDFKSFEFRGVQGKMYDGKGMALFPRKVGGRYFMLGRQDSENIWVLNSDDVFTWDNDGERVVKPRYPWEFIQMGNCGSPIELDEGWLVLTHGVGVVRNYCMGACLLDKDDPTKLLARTPEPILEPDGKARDGYVPNVVYSCGSLLRGRTLLLPYGVADNFTAMGTIEVDRLLKAMV